MSDKRFVLDTNTIISGDQGLLVLRSIRGIPILTADEFL